MHYPTQAANDGGRTTSRRRQRRWRREHDCIPPLVIGHSANPRCFCGRPVDESKFEYRSTPKAWMSQELFFDWLHRFEAYIASTAGRRVALLVDNASCHGTYDTLPNLLHLEVLFLPKNSTSRTQPLDAGIIACIKRRFRR